jgi:hypothetical protein
MSVSFILFAKRATEVADQVMERVRAAVGLR